MAKAAYVNSMNISVIKLVDKTVSEIIDSATHVALYEYNEQSCEWKESNVEGALFVYSRHREQPRYSFIVLNRLKIGDLVEPINENIELHSEEPFLLYKNCKDEIHCIWFLQKEECSTIATTFKKLVRDISKSNMDTSLVKTSDPIKRKQVRFCLPDDISEKVADFFLRAGSTATFQASAHSAPPGITKQLADVNPPLQGILSILNPVTVEQLEQQLLSSPQDIPIARGSRTMIRECMSRRPMALPVESSPKIENGMDLLHLSESPPQGSSTPSLVPTHLNNNTHSPLEPLEVRILEQPDVRTMEMAPKLVLIPPAMYLASSKKKQELLTVKPERLTKSQLLQAVTYLLENDTDFVNKLHEAYIKSSVDCIYLKCL